MGQPSPETPDQTVAGPLTGLTAVVCRAVADREPLVADLLALGATPVLAPLTERAPAPDGGVALAAAIERLDSFAWVAVTSANGARALAETIDARPWPSATRVAAVGPATAAALARHDLPVDLVASSASAAGLVAAMPSAEGAGCAVLAPLAEAAAPTLADGLTARGYRVEVVTAYTTREPSEAAAPELPAAVASADAALMTAPSVVDRFVARFGSTGLPPRTVAIGPRTAAQARARALPGVVMARDHDRGGLVRALLDSVAPYRSGPPPEHRPDCP